MVLRFSLAQALKLSGLEEIPSVSNPTWENWARLESARRAKLLAFCVLNIQDIAYRMSPIIWYHEIRLRLACSCPEWTAPDAITWGLLRQNILTEQPQYNEALKDLLSMAEDPVNDCLPTPVSNYILLHGLLQQIMWSQILPADFLSESLADGHMLFRLVVHKPFDIPITYIGFRTALGSWTIFSQLTFESNLEPLDPNGPLPFTSTALLSLAYIRNCMRVNQKDLGTLPRWDPATMAISLHESQLAKYEGDRLVAAHHACHFLGILVKLGLQYVKNNQASVWNIEAALCGLECAVLLDKLLREFQTKTRETPLTGQCIHNPSISS
jgi:hypothetical protein